MKHDQVIMGQTVLPARVILATDSGDPSGVGHHMLTLAAHLGPDWAPQLAFAAGPAAAMFVERAKLLGLPAQAVAPDGWEKLFIGEAGLLHIHAGIGWEGHGLAALGRLAGWPVVRTEHLPWLITDPAQRQDYAAMLADIDALIAVSPSAGTSLSHGLSRLGRHPPVSVIRNGIAKALSARSRDDVRTAMGLPLDAPLLLHVARFTPQKAHLTLVAAFAQLTRSHPSAHLMMIGTGPTRQATALAVQQAGLTGISFSDPRDDVADLMAAADILVLPSLFEGLPLVLLEAMAVGLPIVASRTGGIVDALGADHPFLVPPGSADALARAMASCLDDRKGAQTLALRHRFENLFTASQMTRATAEVYREAQRLTQRKTAMQALTKVGFIGAGGIAERHLDVLRRFADVRIAAITDADPGRAADMATRFGAQIYDSADAMIADADLDAVFICVPPFAHGPAERSAIAAGLPFFVEKPITLDRDLAESLAAAVAEKGLITAVGYHWRYMDTVEQARRAFQGNPVQLIVGHWLDSTPPPQWWGREDHSGGQMVEQVTHLIDTARYLAGAVHSVHALGNHLSRDTHPGLDVATASVATLRFDGGAIATFSATCLLNWAHRSGLHLFANGLAVELSDREVMVDVGHGRHPDGAGGDPVWREDRDFIDAVRGMPNQIRTTYAEALETHRVALAIATSMRTGEVIRLPPSTGPATIPTGTLLRREPVARDQHRRIRSLGVEGPHRAGFFDYEEGPAQSGEVRIDTCFTGLSAGTELTFLKNTNPYLFSSWDAAAGVFRDGEPSVRYPVPFMGYMEMGRVIDSQSPDFQNGDLVAGTWGHKSGHTANPSKDLLVALPPGLDPLLGVFVAQMGPIAANAILYADALMHGRTPVDFGAGVKGKRVLVWGGGTVGLFTALFARAAGAAEVVVAEPSAFRRHIATKLGVQAELEDAAWQLAKTWGTGTDRGADLVFQTRAHSGSLHLALRALRPQGTVIDLAFYQGGLSDTRLGEEFHHNGLGLIAAQIGRVPSGLSDAWTRRRLSEQTLSLLATDGPAVRAHMITHVVPFDEAPGFLNHLVADRPEFLQIVFEVPS